MTSTIHTTTPASDRNQEVRDRAAAAIDLARWEELDEKYDACAAAARDRQLDAAFGPIGGAR
jgi:hypothetical protein